MNQNIKANIEEVASQLSPQCRLVAVSKTKPIEMIQHAYDAGQRVFGENKVQEIVPKHEALPKDIEWHFIGHLQSNKVKYIAPFVHLIHAVDSLKLLKEIEKQAKKNNRVIDCLLQVHIAEEEHKFGFDEKELMEVLSSADLVGFSAVRIVGLMGMATFTDDQDALRKEFNYLASLYAKVQQQEFPNCEWKELSMGMSGDYPLAIEAGSTLIRVGSAIFGSRY